PQVYMRELMGDEACTRIGIRPVPGHAFLRWVAMHVHVIFKPFEDFDGSRLGRFGERLFRKMISKAYNGEVTFTVPTTMQKLKNIVRDSKLAAAP
ncbi:MAG TPA: hypothetical protein VK569_08185, partial [Bacteroidota bacterium]|nr:hypothetical protein [Bacteroidota bacterium]